MFLDLFGNCPDPTDNPVFCLSGIACMKVPPFCMKLIRPNCRIGNPGPFWAWISFANILSGGSPERVHTVPLLCPNTIPAPFGHGLMPVNVFRSLRKLPGSHGQSRILPFRNSVYESPPFLHEIDPAHPPDWQSGPDLCPDLPKWDTVRGANPVWGSPPRHLGRYGSSPGPYPSPSCEVLSPGVLPALWAAGIGSTGR